MQPSDTLPVRQTKFSNGEISPLMYGDVSHPKWAASLRGCKNWLPTPQGALVNRPGFKIIDSARNDAVSIGVPVSFSDGQSFLLVLSENGGVSVIIRFYKNGQYVGFGGLGSGLYRELALPTLVGALPYLKFSQVGDTVTITYAGQAAGLPAMAPQDLTHTPGALWPWAIAAAPLKIPVGAVTWGAGPTDVVGGYTYTGAGTGPVWNKGERSFYLDAAVPPNLTEWVCIQDNTRGQTRGPPGVPGQPAVALNAAATGLAGDLWWMPAVDVDHPAVKSTWVQTAVVQDAAGVVYESAPSPVLLIDSSLAIDRQRAIKAATPVLAGGYTLLYYRFYRAAAGGLFGWLDDATPAQLVSYPGGVGLVAGCYLDDGRAPDFSQQPPAGTDPFLINGADSYPAVSGYFDQKRLFAGSALIPMGIDLSRTGDFYNWDRPTPGADTDALKIIIAGEKLEQVRSFAAMRRGIVMTGEGEWALSGPNGGAISKSGKELKWQSGWGSGWLSPIKIGTGLIFNTSMDNMIRDFFPLYGRSDIWDGQELSFMARHLFDLFTVKSWALQRVPYPVIWAVRSDGKLLSLTYQHAPVNEFGQQLAEGVAGWAVHDTGGAQSDSFESVCVVKEGSEDVVYAIVKRTVLGVAHRFIERMNSPVCPASPYAAGVSDPRYGVYLDAAVVYDGHNDKIGYFNVGANADSYPNPGLFSLADFVAGNQITINVVGGAFVAGDADAVSGGGFVFDPENVLGLGVVRAKFIGYVGPTQMTAELLDPAPSVAWLQAWTAHYGGQQNFWGITKRKITNANINGYALDTLNANGARGVNVLADGSPAAVASFAAGVLTLVDPALVICAGLSYNCDVSFLDAHHPGVDIRSLKKKLLRIGFEVGGARGVWGGASFDKLWEWEQRLVADGVGNIPLATGYYEFDVTDSWDKGGRAVMRQIDPLPMVLTSVLREYSIGGA